MTGILNLPGLRELDRKELEDEYHVKAEPAAISRLCPHCGELHRVQRTVQAGRPESVAECQVGRRQVPRR